MADVKVTGTVWKTNAGDRLGVTTLTFSNAIPEPSSLTILGIGLCGIVALRQRFKRSVGV
jgi:hypothetical protein